MRDALCAAHPDLSVEIIGITTEGDRRLQSRLADFGGKGLFIKELEQRLLDLSADIAVHSMKDVTTSLPAGLLIPVVMARDDPRDALLAPGYTSLAALPTGAVIGTSSLRRRCQLSVVRPDVRVKILRGNVGTRLSRLDAGEYQALVLATAGLHRLSLHERITTVLEIEQMLPAVGQGAIGVECREDDGQALALLQSLDDVATHRAVRAERAVAHRLDAGCHAPLAAHATMHGGTIMLRGLVGRVDGSEIIADEAHGSAEAPEDVGYALAEQLLQRGAGKILAALGADSTGSQP